MSKAKKYDSRPSIEAASKIAANLVFRSLGDISGPKSRITEFTNPKTGKKETKLEYNWSQDEQNLFNEISNQTKSLVDVMAGLSAKQYIPMEYTRDLIGAFQRQADNIGDHADNLKESLRSRGVTFDSIYRDYNASLLRAKSELSDIYGGANESMDVIINNKLAQQGYIYSRITQEKDELMDDILRKGQAGTPEGSARIEELDRRAANYLSEFHAGVQRAELEKLRLQAQGVSEIKNIDLEMANLGQSQIANLGSLLQEDIKTRQGAADANLRAAQSEIALRGAEQAQTQERIGAMQGLQSGYEQREFRNLGLASDVARYNSSAENQFGLNKAQMESGTVMQGNEMRRNDIMGAQPSFWEKLGEQAITGVVTGGTQVMTESLKKRLAGGGAGS